jgi:hypothetical protein
LTRAALALRAALLLLKRALIASLGTIISERLRGGVVVETFGFFAHKAAANEALQLAHVIEFIRGDEADRVADGMGATGATDAVDVIFHDVREVEIHDVGDAVHVNATRGDVSGDEHTHLARFEVI